MSPREQINRSITMATTTGIKGRARMIAGILIGD